MHFLGILIILFLFQHNKELAEQLHLERAEFYNYLNQSGCVTLEGISEGKKFDALRLAFNILQVPSEMCDGLFKVLAAILWLGNLSFEVSFQYTLMAI